MQREVPNDAYMTEFLARLRALKDAEDIGLAQYDIIDDYFSQDVPFFHLVTAVPASARAARRGVTQG